MANKPKQRVSYHGDARYLSALAEAMMTDARIEADQRAKICAVLNTVASQLLTMAIGNASTAKAR